jgi:hypothetical protein
VTGPGVGSVVSRIEGSVEADEGALKEGGIRREKRTIGRSITSCTSEKNGQAKREKETKKQMRQENADSQAGDPTSEAWQT